MKILELGIGTGNTFLLVIGLSAIWKRTIHILGKLGMYLLIYIINCIHIYLYTLYINNINIYTDI